MHTDDLSLNSCDSITMAMWKTDCIEKPIRIFFEKIGKFIGLHPWWFIIIPLVLSTALGGGFYLFRERINNDIEDQFTPMDGLAKGERRYIQETFPQNDSMFSRLRLNTDGIQASVIFTCQPNIFTEPALEEILRTDAQVRRMTVKSDSGQFAYVDICAKVNHTCSSNALLDIFDYNASNIDLINITFPMHSYGNFHLGNSLGLVKMDNNSVVQRAEAIRLFYYLREDDTRANMWLEEFMNLLSNESNIITKVSYYTSESRLQEFEKSSKSVIHLFAVTYFLAITFSIISCMRFDNVRNKVWLATLGVLSTGLAVLSSFGLLLIMGVPLVITVASSPFLILGIGIDDMFIMISCWQQTKVHDKVDKRMADTYKEAAISITITTLTDVLVFFLSYSNPFGCVQSFCLYTGTAILFCYLINITFFGACLALNGRREGDNRHWLTCMKAPEVSLPGSSKGYALCCVGGAYDHNTELEEEQPMRRFFRRYYGPFLTTTWAKVSVTVLYVAYLAISIYGCTLMQDGIDLKNLATDGSYIIKYYEDEKAYFSEYGPNVMLAIQGEFPYWEENKLTALDSCLAEFGQLHFVNKKLSESYSWLHSFERYAKENNVNISSETAFKASLLPFLEHQQMFKEDINYTDNKINASRLFLQIVNITSAAEERNMLESLRETAKSCHYPLLVYHPAFIYYDQYLAIVNNTIQSVLLATVVMLMISLLLIPKLLCALWVTFAIVSVVVGVAGFMALWNVNLDSISMINLIICIGFSVDFSAHISYAFASSTKPNVNDRVVDALSLLGYPILQGALSTLLGVVVLAASASYIFRTFFKIMFLVILFGLLHGIAFIPVFLTFFGMCNKCS